MCLSYLDDRVEERYGKKEFGWKVFERRRGELVGMFTGYKPRLRKQWLREDRFRKDRSLTKMLTEQRTEYPAGWHIYLLRIDARENRDQYGGVVKKVRFRRPVAWGKQDGCPVVVAKEIFIE